MNPTNPPEVGSFVTHSIWTDANALQVIAVSASGKTIRAQEAKQELLNGANSGEPDALTFTPGGFVGHTSGKQRWKVEPNPEGRILKFTWREKRKRYQLAGTNGQGNTLRAGASPHYDFNF